MPPQKYRFILVEPEYELNLGAAARLMRNFGQSPLYLVKPAAAVGFTARMHAKHAVDVLEKAVVCKSLEEAVEGCSQVVGTSGVLVRHREALRHPLTLEEFRSRMATLHVDMAKQADERGKRGRATSAEGAAHGPIAILFGREGIGLSESELARCDVLVTIPTTKKYPVMNLSHALAVVLYALTAQEKKLRAPGIRVSAGERKYLLQTFDALADRYAHNLLHPQRTKLAFRRIVGRAIPDKAETLGMLTVLKQALRELSGEKVWMPPKNKSRKA